MNPPSIPYVQREDAIAGSACIGSEISKHHTETKSMDTVKYGLEADVNDFCSYGELKKEVEE